MTAWKRLTSSSAPVNLLQPCSVTFDLSCTSWLASTTFLETALLKFYCVLSHLTSSHHSPSIFVITLDRFSSLRVLYPRLPLRKRVPFIGLTKTQVLAYPLASVSQEKKILPPPRQVEALPLGFPAFVALMPSPARTVRAQWLDQPSLRLRKNW